INARPARRRERSQRAVCAELLRLVAAIDAGIHATGPHALVAGDLRVEAGELCAGRLVAQVMRRHEIAAQLVAVRVVKEPAEVVLRNAPLAAAAREFAAPGAVSIAEADEMVRAVNPIVHRPEQTVGGV